MIFSEIKLPSNQKFGYFFTIIIASIAIYFFYRDNILTSFIALLISLFFFLTSIFKASLLLPLNKAWMRLGFLIGMLVNPLVLGFIFFLLFTPLALIMRLFNRDELRLKVKNRSSHWKKRNIEETEINDFKQQF